MQATEALYSENIAALSSFRGEELVSLFQQSGSSFLSELLLNPGTTVLDMALKAKCFENERKSGKNKLIFVKFLKVFFYFR